jgi:hypothetical protein
MDNEAVGALLTAWLVRAHLLSERALQALLTAVGGGAAAPPLLASMRQAGWIERVASRQALYRVGATGQTYARGVGWALPDRSPPADRWRTLAMVNDVAVSLVIGAADTAWVHDVTWLVPATVSDPGASDGIAVLCYDRLRRARPDPPAWRARYEPFPSVRPTSACYTVELHLFVDDGRLAPARPVQAGRPFGRLLRQRARTDPSVGMLAVWVVPTQRRAAWLWTQWMQTANAPLWMGGAPPDGWEMRPGWAWTDAHWHDEHGRRRCLGPLTEEEWRLRAMASPAPQANPWTAAWGWPEGERG